MRKPFSILLLILSLTIPAAFAHAEVKSLVEASGQPEAHEQSNDSFPFFGFFQNFLNPYSGGPINSSNSELVDIRLLKARPAGAGGILPFRVSDVRNQIDPDTRSVTTRTTSSTGTTTTGGGTTTPTGPTYTCPDGTSFPAAAPTSLSIDFLLPAAGGACQLGVSLSPAGDVAWRLGSATSTNATLTGQNGWVASPTTVSISGVGADNAVTITKSGVTYTMTVTISTNLAGGMRAVITNFTRL